MGLYLGLAFREHMLGKYGEPIVSELDQLVASIQGHLEDIVQARKSAIKATQSAINAGLESLEELVDAHETRLDQHDTRIDALEGDTASGGGNPSILFHRTFAAASVDGDTVFTYSLPAGTLTGDNQAVNLHAWGHFSEINAATKFVGIRFNGTTIAGPSSSQGSETSYNFWEAKLHIARTSSSVGRVSGTVSILGSSVVGLSPVMVSGYKADTVLWASQSPVLAISMILTSNTTNFVRVLHEVTITKENA